MWIDVLDPTGGRPALYSFEKQPIRIVLTFYKSLWLCLIGQYTARRSAFNGKIHHTLYAALATSSEPDKPLGKPLHSQTARYCSLWHRFNEHTHHGCSWLSRLADLLSLLQSPSGNQITSSWTRLLDMSILKKCTYSISFKEAFNWLTAFFAVAKLN